MPDFPFYHFFIDDFLSPEDLLFIENAVVSADFDPRASDLFNFSQTKELKSLTGQVYDILKNKYFEENFISKLESVCGEKLENRFDTSFQKYTQNDYLLTHDDLLENRAFAYVLYLVDASWSESDGGCLALLDCDQTGNPRNIVGRIVPKRNRLALFQVSHKSFHYVEEVLSSTNNRYSLTGWFYTAAGSKKPLPSFEKLSIDFEGLLEEISTNESTWEYIQQLDCAAQYHTTFSTNPLSKTLQIDENNKKLIKRWSLFKFESTDYLLGMSILKGCFGFTIFTKDGARVEPNDCIDRWLTVSENVIISPSIQNDSKVYLLVLYA